nr:hypothetical protein [Pseudomonas sp.]
MNRIQRMALAALSSFALAGAAAAANPTATATDQQPAADPTDATKPRLPAAADTHRAGPTQSEAGSGDVRDVPPTLREGASPGPQVTPGAPDADGARDPNATTSDQTEKKAPDAGMSPKQK